MTPIKHLFVLMMENRSFDHLFAFSGMPGVPAPDPRFRMTASAPDCAPLDPPHEFEDVQQQIGGTPPMSGFAGQSYWNVSGQGFAAGQLPIITTLANQYFLFDNWYSSMPGPTWPNRFFVHAGSSGGLDNSPSAATTIESETLDTLGFTFQNGTLFQRLQAAGRSWRVYHDDLFPQVLAIKSMIDPFRVNSSQFSWLRFGGQECFVNDLANDYAIDYTFIEPNYGLAGGALETGNSQHPKGSMAAGEAFIKYVYESIRNSPVWPLSLLIVSYDEHGGFFDGCGPPAAAPPADTALNYSRAASPQDFGFDRLGVRVPALAISPWIPKGGLGSRSFPNQVFDHTAIIRTALESFGVSGSLTARDAAATSILSLCLLPEMRTGDDAPATLPQPAGAALQSLNLAPTDPESAPTNTLKAFSRIAMSLDLAVAAAGQQPTVAVAHPSFTERPALTGAADGAVGAAGAGAATPGDPVQAHALAAARTHRQTVDYIQSVAERVRQARAALTPPDPGLRP